MRPRTPGSTVYVVTLDLLGTSGGTRRRVMLTKAGALGVLQRAQDEGRDGSITRARLVIR